MSKYSFLNRAWPQAGIIVDALAIQTTATTVRPSSVAEAGEAGRPDMTIDTTVLHSFCGLSTGAQENNVWLLRRPSSIGIMVVLPPDTPRSRQLREEPSESLLY